MIHDTHTVGAWFSFLCIGVGNVNTVKISDMSIKTKEDKTQTKCLFFYSV